ncbi:hypothetical protein [Microvirga thermotolerans]|uniref:Uncharacterized protein n=1 Tax=Microvirga thermotolerans TaxID=2651334 RepID=A0A5P9JSV6_9HYPH|nr:hypothetical protein [Microvirga thermotolerans]QFU15493.1 hypothetical protein GDR74_04260 [Microvirga thermotolerans]
MARDLLNKYPTSEHDDFRMATLMFGLTPELGDVFQKFRSGRTALHKAVDYRRNRSGVDRAGWQTFGLAGALEVDMFPANRFSDLGVEKQDQYRNLGFKPATAGEGPVWIVTAHALVHVGSLGHDAVMEALHSVAPIVHLKELDEQQTLLEAAERVVGYACKVSFETTFAFGRKSSWPTEAVKTYLLGTMRSSHGYQGFRFVVNPKSSKKKSSMISDSHIEPMVTMVGL